MTGSSGFIGKKIVKCFLDRVISSLQSSETKIKKLFDFNKNHSFIISSISDFSSSVVNAFCQSDIILHCAGSVRGRLPDDFKTANIDAIQNFADLAKISATKPGFILISSLAARQPELSDYSFSKWKGEQALHSSSFKWVILRPTAVYGP